ncbi:MAG: hypothetical protein RBU37_07435 [Myxococcota bacterium]|nr:hypothetical protein [Myxococcota bacterium]
MNDHSDTTPVCDFLPEPQQPMPCSMVCNPHGRIALDATGLTWTLGEERTRIELSAPFDAFLSRDDSAQQLILECRQRGEEETKSLCVAAKAPPQHWLSLSTLPYFASTPVLIGWEELQCLLSALRFSMQASGGERWSFPLQQRPSGPVQRLALVPSGATVSWDGERLSIEASAQTRLWVKRLKVAPMVLGTVLTATALLMALLPSVPQLPAWLYGLGFAFAALLSVVFVHLAGKLSLRSLKLDSVRLQSGPNVLRATELEQVLVRAFSRDYETLKAQRRSRGRNGTAIVLEAGSTAPPFVVLQDAGEADWLAQAIASFYGIAAHELRLNDEAQRWPLQAAEASVWVENAELFMLPQAEEGAHAELRASDVEGVSTRLLGKDAAEGRALAFSDRTGRRYSYCDAAPEGSAPSTAQLISSESLQALWLALRPVADLQRLQALQSPEMQAKRQAVLPACAELFQVELQSAVLVLQRRERLLHLPPGLWPLAVALGLASAVAALHSAFWLAIALALPVLTLVVLELSRTNTRYHLSPGWFVQERTLARPRIVVRPLRLRPERSLLHLDTFEGSFTLRLPPRDARLLAQCLEAWCGGELEAAASEQPPR